jgi:hemolysin activation/secretion protein
VWGTYPLHEAAYLGGWASLRGFPDQRFAGDAAVFGSAELRVALARFYLLLPGELGIFGLGDGGRVFLAGERADRWHAAAGGGLWFAYLNRANTVSLAAADGGDGVRLYARAGFAF